MHFYRIFGLFVVALSTLLGACASRPEPVEMEAAEETESVTASLSCQQACTSREDCDDGLRCNDDGRCVPCMADADCGEGFCVEQLCQQCRDDANCMDADAGKSRCSAEGTCICATDDECEAPLGWCRSTGCVCDDDAGCADVGPGRCDFGVCIRCDDDAHCEEGPSKCFAGGTQEAYCGCRKDGECAEGLHCEPESGACVQCVEDEHCLAAGLGNTCEGGKCTCAASTDCSADVSHAGLSWVCE